MVGPLGEYDFAEDYRQQYLSEHKTRTGTVPNYGVPPKSERDADFL
jgi:hypothetical protein